MNHQLSLTIQLNDEATLADFCWGSNHVLQQQLIKSLQGNGERFYTIWGSTGCGKSHLLQACCQAMNNTHATTIYLPLATLKEWGPSTIEGIGEQALIAIDDINCIAENEAWEEALFHLYNKVRDNGKTILIISSGQPLATLAIKLADLHSRLRWSLVMQLNELEDELKVKTLQHYACNRGFELPKRVGQFLLKRCARNMHDLHAILNQLDHASLAAQRKITIPFVKSILCI